MLLFGAAYAAPNKSTTILYFLELNSQLSQASISEVEFQHLNQYFFYKLIVLENCRNLLEVLEMSLNVTQTCLSEPLSECFQTLVGCIDETW